MVFASTQTREGERASGICVPRIRLTTAHFTVNRGDDLSPRYEDAELPVIVLGFDYGGSYISASEPPSPIFMGAGSALAVRERDLATERRARVLLETLGAVDLECLSDYGLDPDAEADYLVSIAEDPSVYCAFSALSLPQLEREGFRVEIDPSYPYKLIDRPAQWYSELDSDEEKPGWFQLELGIDIEGKRVDLVSVLLKLLEQSDELPSLRSLQHRNDAFIAVPIEDHGYLRVEPERLKRLFDVLVELYESDGPSNDNKKASFPEERAAALDWLPQELNFTTKEGTDLPAFCKAFLKPAELLDPETMPVKATLRPYQVEGVSWLQHLVAHDVGGVLADDMGLGKTLQTITHLALEHTGNPLLPPSLIICPTSLVGNWKRELTRFAPQLRVALHHGPKRHESKHMLDGADVIVTTYPILLRDEDVFGPLEVHLLVLDEAQAIKSAAGSLHKAVKKLSANHRLCITGTPIENHLGELWALFDFLQPGWLGDETTFRARYRDKAVASLADRSRLESLHHRVAPYVLRRTKEKVAPELPPKINTVVPIELGGKQRELYESIRSAAHDEVRRAIRQKGVGAATLQVLDALMKLRQVCCDPRLVRMEAARFVKHSAKLDKLVELLETHLECKRRVLIFSQFTSMLGIIERTLHERDIDSLLLTGQTENRQAKVDAFERGQADVFLISLKAGGTGLNLTSADTVIHYDPWWNPAAQDQATDRAYRIGQQRSVLVQELLISGSVEERMRALQAQKRELAKAVLEGEAEDAPLLTEASVNELFAPIDA